MENCRKWLITNVLLEMSRSLFMRKFFSVPNCFIDFSTHRKVLISFPYYSRVLKPSLNPALSFSLSNPLQKPQDFLAISKIAVSTCPYAEQIAVITPV